MITVGLTGGIGSGKSTVSAGLVERGAVLVDADAITRELQEPGAAVFEAMVDRFGSGVVASDGTLDRAAVASIVFSDEQALADLNAIVHPKVGEVIVSRMAAAADADPTAVLVLDIPLLAEGRSRDDKPRYELDAILVVDCPVEVAVQRLVRYRGFDEADARRRASAQASRVDRVAMADFVIDNGGDAALLNSQIDRAWEWLGSLDHRAAPPSKPPTKPTEPHEPGSQP